MLDGVETIYPTPFCADPVNRGLYQAKGRVQPDPRTVDAANVGIVDRNRAIVVQRNVDTVVGKAGDLSIHDCKRLTRKIPDSVETCSCAIDRKVSQNDFIVDTCVDNNTAHAASCENRAKARPAAAAVDCNGFSDCNRTEPAWVQSIDLATGGRFRNCAGPCLTWGGAAAWVRIITDTGYPGTGGLRRG